MNLGAWLQQLAERANEAERFGSVAPVASVLRTLATEAEQVDGWPLPPPPDCLITLDAAAKRLGVTTRWLRETRPPYVVALGGKTLRVSEQKLARWLDQGRSAA